MLTPIAAAPAGVVALRAVGTVTTDDYDTVLTPAIEAAIMDHGSVRLVYELGPDFKGYAAGAAWEDAKFGASYLSKWKRCAVVTDHTLLADAVRAFGVIMPGEIRVFPVAGLADAMAWAAA
ncbi:MAG TPA: STAS/SEC14 domain-containing protein [Candidatus Limnocylindrales bacterium]